MHAGQYKRIYNLAFAIVLICTFSSGFSISKLLIAITIIQPQEEELQKVARDEEIRMYNDLIKQGKHEEAKSFLSAPM
jgi:NhaP-type Na+/H+ and K+/H+ antiporter